jgi:hypothetical protein
MRLLGKVISSPFLTGERAREYALLVLQLWIYYCFYYTANLYLYTGGCSKTENVKGPVTPKK